MPLKVLTKLQETHLIVLFISFFFVWVSPSFNTIESSNDFFILIISLIFSTEINKVNLYPVLTAPFHLFFFFFIASDIKLLTNTSKLSLDKEITTFVCAFFPKLENQEQIDPPDRIILNIWILLSFISVGVFLAKTFLISVVCLVARNNSCGSTSSS